MLVGFYNGFNFFIMSDTNKTLKRGAIMKTRQDIENLKMNWERDPIWDIETTEGFEEYHDELLSYRHEKEAAWIKEPKETVWKERENSKASRMSTRLYLAGMAMQGILANHLMVDSDSEISVHWTAQAALKFADELLKQENEEPE